MGEEIERLKRDKSALMQELIKLRQQQQNTDNQMQALGERLQGMEQRQQQMMSFLAKAMRSPSFLSQFVQQNDSNRRVVNVNKKRRLPTQGAPNVDISDGQQMMKYKPFSKDAMLKMLNMQIYPHPETFVSSDNVPTENMSYFPEAHGSSSSEKSGVTVAQVSPNSGVPFRPVSSGSSVVCAASAESVNQSISGASVTNMFVTDELPSVGLMSDYSKESDPCLSGIDVAEFPGFQEIEPGGDGVDIPIEEYLMSDPVDLYVDSNISCGEEVAPIEMNSMNGCEINFYDSEVQLPVPVEDLWDALLSHSSIAGDVEEVDSSIQNVKETKQGLMRGWTSAQNMEHLTAQMGFLSSNPQR